LKPNHFVLAVASVLLAYLPAQAAEEPSYRKDIQPLLTKYCVTCHGGQRTRAGVDLTSVQMMLQGGKVGVPLVPGKPDKSNLVRTIDGGKPVMPPRKAAQKPTKEEINLIRAWVAAGAKDDSKAASLPPAARDALVRTLQQHRAEEDESPH